MPGTVTLEVVEGPMQGRGFVFDEHDTFIFGRSEDCHACLPDDQWVSRHHFIMEANPPDARIRDLGSLNGTFVNGMKYGGRKPEETPEEGAGREYPQLDLKDEDRIKVGRTVIAVRIEVPALCSRCGRSIADADREQCAWKAGTFICGPCKRKLVASTDPVKGPESIRCEHCGKDVSGEPGSARPGQYLCRSCQRDAEEDPFELLSHLLDQLGRDSESPAIEGLEVGERLGRGGYGAVYLARRKNDNRQVALKILLARVAVSREARRRFHQEIELTKSLCHENLVSLLDHGSSGSVFYFIMEYCSGGSIDRLMKQHGGKLPLSDAGPLMLQSLEGLAYVHGRDVVHRDLKPQNILLDGSPRGWRAKIADLGFAKDFQRAGFSGMTMTGDVGGTPAFMPREQVTNFKYVNPTCDVWSMGATFYNMLTGRFPRDFPRGRDPVQIVLQIPAVPIRTRDSSIPPRVAEVIDRALEEKPENRFPDAGGLLKALAAAL